MRHSIACPRCESHVLRPGQRLAASDEQLRADEIDASDDFGDRMLDLQPGIHLEEEETGLIAAALEKELDRAGVDVPDGPRRANRGFAHLLPDRRCQNRAGAFLDHFLMAALHRTLALEHVHGVAVRVAEHLDLDVARPLDQSLDVQRAVAERRHGLAPRLLDRRQDLRSVAKHLHADAAAASRGLDQRREPDTRRRGLQRGIGLIGRRLTRHDGHASGLHQLARADLRTHALDGLGWWPDEHDAGVATGAGKVGAFGQESVAGMNRVGLMRVRCAQQPFHIEIAVARRGTAEVCGDDQPPMRAAPARQRRNRPPRFRCRARGRRE